MSRHTCFVCKASNDWWTPKCPRCGRPGTMRPPGMVAAVAKREAEPPPDDTFRGTKPLEGIRVSTGIAGLDRVLGHNRGDPLKRCGCYRPSVILLGAEAGAGKLLPLHTRVPTPTGWTTMGEILPGDLVFDVDGRPTLVTWCSAVDERPEAWELTFDDGETIVADAGHQWLTLTLAERAAQLKHTPEWRAKERAARPSRSNGRASARFVKSLSMRNTKRAIAMRHRLKVAPTRGSTRTTKQIVETLRAHGNRVNHSIENPAPLQLRLAILPIDPYVLGAWLGDGATHGGRVYGLDDEVFASIEEAGYEVRRQKPATGSVIGLLEDLRIVGVLGNKHIPQVYLRGSFEQRLALLQGLCDTDGHASVRGTVEFTTTCRALRDGVIELLATLGIKPSCREGRATLHGRDISAKWRIQFVTSLPCFRIRRKAIRQKRSGFRGPSERRYIVSARRVASEPMRCIGVDAPTRTYLVGDRMIPTHNSTMLMQMCAYVADRSVLYNSTEQPLGEIRANADALGLGDEFLSVKAREIKDLPIFIEELHRVDPHIVVLDSINDLKHSAAKSKDPNIIQIEIAQALMDESAGFNRTIFVISHLNKEGGFTGRADLSFAVGATLMMVKVGTGKRRHLRAIKNRFGGTHEIALFDMEETGLVDVEFGEDSQSAAQNQQSAPDAPSTPKRGMF